MLIAELHIISANTKIAHEWHPLPFIEFIECYSINHFEATGNFLAALKIQR